MCIICNDAKSCVRRIFLHDPPQCHLRRGRHGVCLVQNDQLVCWHGGRCRGRVHGEDLFCASEGFNLFADYVDTTVVGGVELKDHLPHVLRTVDFSCKGEDCRCLSGSGRTVEEEMWESLRSCQLGVPADFEVLLTFVSTNLLIVARMSW